MDFLNMASKAYNKLQDVAESNTEMKSELWNEDKSYLIKLAVRGSTQQRIVASGILKEKYGMSVEEIKRAYASGNS